MDNLIILTGPTGVGKTALSIKLAKLLDTEIISADSMQVYKKLNIGSAKVTTEEMQGIRHHLIDVLEPTEDFDITKFQTMAKGAIDEITGKNRVPLMCGGTGFYIQSVIYDVDFKSEEEDKKLQIRNELTEYCDKNGREALHLLLKDIDSKSYDTIPAGNVKRVMRAIEYFRLNGEKISDHNEEQQSRKSRYNLAYFVLTDDRQKLYDRINLRVDKMVEAGLFDEVKALMDMGITLDNTCMQGIGYREVYRYYTNELSYEEAIDLIKQNSRHYAKRQLTWFRREKDVIFIDKSTFSGDEEILEFIKENIKRCKINYEKGIRTPLTM